MAQEGFLKKFRLLFIFEVLAKNIISILQISLIFYLTKNLNLDTEHAFKWLASFGMVAYASPLFAGYITDNILGPSRSMLLGLLIMLSGSLLALHESLEYSLIGMVLVGSGSGFFKPNILTLLDNLFKKQDEKRSLYFGKFYLASSVGEVIAVVVTGIFTEYFFIHNPFYLTTLSLTAALILYFLNKNKLLENQQVSPIQSQRLLYIIPAALSTIFFSIYYGVNEVILLGSLTALYIIIRNYWKEGGSQKNKASLKILIMIAYGALFFSLTVQCYFALNLAVENFVDRKITDTYSIPTSWFLLINPVISLMVGNFVSDCFKKYDLVKRMIYGFFTLSLGYSILFFSFYFSGNKVNLLPILGSYVMFVIGMFVIIPQLIADLTYNISSKYKSRGVGVWYLTSYSQKLCSG